MTPATQIETRLSEEGVSVDGVVVWPRRRQYYAVGFEAEELPDVEGFTAVDDPALNEPY